MFCQEKQHSCYLLEIREVPSDKEVCDNVVFFAVAPLPISKLYISTDETKLKVAVFTDSPLCNTCPFAFFL